jgi:hypothetical protein
MSRLNRPIGEFVTRCWPMGLRPRTRSSRDNHSWWGPLTWLLPIDSVRSLTMIFHANVRLRRRLITLAIGMQTIYAELCQPRPHWLEHSLELAARLALYVTQWEKASSFRLTAVHSASYLSTRLRRLFSIATLCLLVGKFHIQGRRPAVNWYFKFLFLCRQTKEIILQ